MEMEKRGYMYGIPVFIKLSTFDLPEVHGRNFFWDCLLVLVLWIASNILMVKSIPIIEEDEEM